MITNGKRPLQICCANVKAGQKDKQNVIMEAIPPPNFRNLPFTFSLMNRIYFQSFDPDH